MAGILLVIGAGALLPGALVRDRFPHDALVLSLLAGAGVVLAFTWQESRELRPPKEIILPLHPWPLRLLGLALILTGIALGTLAAARIWRVDNDLAGIRAWVGAVFLLAVGGYVLGPYVGWRREDLSRVALARSEWTSPLPFWVEVAGVVTLMALGTVLRLYRLQSVPPGIFVDETNAAGDALRIMDGWQGSPFGVGWFETPLGYAYYLVGLFKVLGTTFTALKAASLIPALLTLLALYPLARELFGPPTALASLALLAVNRWHMTMSRWGWNEVAPPLFHILTLYFLLRGSRTRRMGDFLLAGVLMGLGMYTYLASRLVVLSILAYLVYRVVVQRGYLRRAWPGLLLFLVAYVLTFAPLATTYARNPFTLLNRSRQVSILNDMRGQYTPEIAPPPAVQSLLRAVGAPTTITFRPLRESLWKHLRMFHVEGDHNARHNLPGAPMLDPVTGVLFLLGAIYALWRVSDHRRGLLLIWVAVVLLGGILSLVREAPQGYRTLGVVPAVVILAGDTLARTVLTLQAWVREGAEEERVREGEGTVGSTTVVQAVTIVATGAALGVLGWAGWLNVDLFFNRWAGDPRVWAAFTPMETAVAREVTALLATHDVYLSPTLYWGSPVRFLTYRPASEGGGVYNPPFRSIQPVEDLPLSEEIGDNVLFLLEPLYTDLLELFTAYYPHTRASTVRGPRGELLYLSVTVPADDVRALRGLTATYEEEGGRVERRRDLVLDFVWPEDFPPGLIPTRITWEGSLRVPHTGRYDLRGEGELAVEVDGEPWSGPRVLAKGLHALRVVQERPGEAGRERVRLMWREAGQEWNVVPGTVLFSVPPPQHGLLGRYYMGAGWQGTPLFSRVDRTLFMAWIDPEPVVGPFSVTWTGWLIAPDDGRYHFTLDADDGVRFWLDGELLGESLRPDTVNQVQVDVTLTAGPHQVRVDYFQRGGAKTLTFRWRPPGKRDTVVPPSALRPG